MFARKKVETIDSIVADVQNRVDALKDISQAKQDEALYLSDEVLVLQMKQKRISDESNRAAALASNFSKLLEV